MYNKNNTGNYLRELLLRKNISRLDFCKEWAKADNEDPEDKQIIENKNADLSKRINGNIHIQIEEYPVFSKILGVSIAELLSAGEFKHSNTSRLTNRIVALSDDKNVWEKYLENEEKPFLFRDEFGKSIIDYALAFSNYELLKFIIEKRIILFSIEPDKSNEQSFENEFRIGAVTNPDLWKYNKHTYHDPNFSNYSITTRSEIIHLALENGDADTLRKLNANTPYFITAREWHDYSYRTSSSFFKDEGIIENESLLRKLYYDSDMIKLIIETKCENIILYFTEYIKSERENQYIFFPFIDEVITGLINNCSYSLATIVISKLITHYKKYTTD